MASHASPRSPPAAVKSITKLTYELTLALTDNALDVSGKLLGEGLICCETRTQMLIMCHTPKEKAAILVAALINTIERHPDRFEDLLQVLSEQLMDSEAIVKELRSIYQELNAGTGSGAGDSAQDTQNTDVPQPMSKRIKLTESEPETRSSLSDEPDVCEAAEVPHRRSSLNISNPIVESDLSELEEDDQENVRNKIQSLTTIIRGEFLKLGKELLQSMKARQVERKSFVYTLTQCEVYSAEEKHKVSLFQLHKKDLLNTSDIYDIFMIISPYYSWFNYELFKEIVNTHGSDEDKANMQRYCQDFSEYCKRIPCVEFQDSNSKSSCQTKIKFKLDYDNIESLNHYDIKHIQRSIAEILNLKSSVLVLSDVQNGCMALTFLVPAHIASQLVQLATDKKATLHKEIKMISAVQEHDDLRPQKESTHKCQELLVSAKQGDLKRVETLINSGVNIDTVDEKNCTALLHASHEDYIDVVRFLLQEGANKNWQADGGWTALMLASYRGHVEVVELLLKYSSDVNRTTEQGWTALQRVCLYNQARYPEAKYKPSERCCEVAKLLIDHGTDLMKIDKQGQTPLIAASDSGFAGIVKLLVDKISELPEKERQKYLDYKKHFSWTALMSASEKGHAEVVKILIEAGASRSITKDKDEVSALHIAVQNGHVEVIEALTHKMDKDDLNARDNYGMTPLILATKRKSEQLMNVLLHAGADVDVQSTDKEEMTALMFAVKVGSFDVVKLLVERSANLFAKNSSKKTVLEMAKDSSKEIRDYLSEKCKQAEEEQHSQKATEVH